MPSDLCVAEDTEGAFPGPHADPRLDAAMAEAHGTLAALIDEMTTSGLLLEPDALRELRACATRALDVAVTYRRHVRAYGYSCRFPGLHCGASDPLDAVLGALRARGWRPHEDPDAKGAAAAITCICGEPMGYTGLRRGRGRRGWAVCASWAHWAVL